MHQPRAVVSWRGVAGGRSELANGFQAPIHDNGDFRLAARPDVRGLRVSLHRRWTRPRPIGPGKDAGRSRSLTPSHYGETLASPPRAVVLPKAWTLWRARACGFADTSHGRELRFNDEVARLERDVHQMQAQADGVLGSPAASALLDKLVPDACARICNVRPNRSLHSKVVIQSIIAKPRTHMLASH